MGYTYVVLVKGVVGQLEVDVEGLDKTDKDYQAIISSLGFMMAEGGVVVNKPRFPDNSVPVLNNGLAIVLRPYMFPTDALTILRDFDFKIVSSAVGSNNVVVWTLEKHWD